MKQAQKQYIFFGFIIIILLAVGVFFYVKSKPSKQNAQEKKSVFEEPTEIIPTVDSSVKVDIEGSKDAVIKISGIQTGTDSIEYQLTYATASGGNEGVLGVITKITNSKAEKDITFGTCSSGVCRYHEIDGPVTGVFKFSGTYGDRLLETTFEL